MSIVEIVCLRKFTNPHILAHFDNFLRARVYEENKYIDIFFSFSTRKDISLKFKENLDNFHIATIEFIMNFILFSKYLDNIYMYSPNMSFKRQQNC